jgi:nucleotide-binding universal stress UspA family protein
VKVLVCTDFSSAAAAGEREAARRHPDAELVLFHATEPRLVRLMVEVTGADGEALRRDMAVYADARMNEVVGRLQSEGRRAVAELVEGDAVDEALAAAGRHGAELIVMGATRGAPVGRFRTQLARRSAVPVLFIPAEE